MLTTFFYNFLSLILRGSQETKLQRKKRYKKVEIRFENFYGSTTTKPHFSVASYTIYSRVNSLTLCVLLPVVIYTIDAVVWCLREKDVYMESTNGTINKWNLLFMVNKTLKQRPSFLNKIEILIEN